MILLPEIAADFSGGVNDAVAATAYEPDEAAVIRNGRVTARGTIKPRRGTRRASSDTPGTTPYGAIEFRPTGAAVQWVRFMGAVAQKSTDEGATWSDIDTGLRQDYWSLVTLEVGGVNKLYAANGDSDLYEYDGTTWAALSGTSIPADVKYLAAANNRLWASDGIRVYACAVSDPTDWSSESGGLSLPVSTNDGEAVTALYGAGDGVLVFKRESTSAVNGFGEQDLIVAAGASGVSGSTGCIAFRSIAGADDPERGLSGIFWLSERGVEFYAPGNGIRLVSGRLRRFFESIAVEEIIAAPGIPEGEYSPRDNAYHLLLPINGAQNEVKVVVSLYGRFPLVYDTYADDTTGSTLYEGEDGYVAVSSAADRRTIRVEDGYGILADAGDSGLYADTSGDYLAVVSADTAPAVLFRADREGATQALVGIGYDGIVRYLEDGTKDDALADGTGGTTIPAVFRPRPFLWGAPSRKKHVRKVHVQATASADTPIDVVLLADGVEGTTHTKTVRGTSGDRPRKVKVGVNGKCDTADVEIRFNGDLGEITAVTAYAELLSERL